MQTKLRVVVGARVSVLKGDEKVSHIAQHEAGMRWAKAHDAEVVGTFEDLDVSATVSPFDRPDLGPWLTDEKSYEWDAIIWAKIDRAFRDPKDSVAVATWAEKRKKVLVFADDGLILDFRDDADMMARMMGEAFLLMGSLFGKWELKRFQGRAISAHSVLKHTDRWAGGVPPEGYKTAPHPSGKGRTLVQDPERQKMLHEVAKLLIVEKQSINGVAKWLQEKGYEPTRDYHRPAGKKRGDKWSAQQVIGMMTSLNTQGIKMTGAGKNSRPVLDDEGKMIQIAPPTFDNATWEQIQNAIAERRYGPKKRVNGASPLHGVVFCGKCGAKANHRITRRSYGTYRYYNCGNPLNGCTGLTAKAEDIETLVEETFLWECGCVKELKRQFVPGEDHTAELERVNQIINALREDREMGLIVGEADEERYRTQMRSLLDQRTALEQMPQRKAGWITVEGEETYADLWARSSTEERRRLLVDAGVKVHLRGKNNWEVYVPEDIKNKLAGIPVER